MVGFAMGATTRDRRNERPPLGTERQKSVVIVRMSSTNEGSPIREIRSNGSDKTSKCESRADG